MKKTNKKGFTLVELLAVIVILGVLLMIAVPAIQNVIRSSRKKSFESAAQLVIENIEAVASAERVTGDILPCYVLIDKNFELERGSLGTNPSGYVTVDAKGKGTIKYTDGTYRAEGTLNNITTSKSGNSIGAPTDLQKCTWWG